MEDYIGRVNRVLDYIEQNIANEFTLDELASVACFSKFHFHRIFNSRMGETVMRFIQRIRLERAAIRLRREREVPITEIGFDCGFNNLSAFTRAFREKFDQTPSEWRGRQPAGDQNSNFSISNSNISQARMARPRYIGTENSVRI